MGGLVFDGVIQRETARDKKRVVAVNYFTNN